MKITYLLTILFFGFSSIVNAQSITNIKAVFLDDKIIVSYDLIASDALQKFDVDLYSSVNNYSRPLVNVKGDVGKGLTAARGKRIELDVLSELGKYEGDITFEVRAGVLVSSTPPSTANASNFLNPMEGSKFKRGKVYQIRWAGINESDVELELYKSGVKQNTMGKSNKEKDFSWVVPEDTKPGTDYQIKLVSGTNKNIITSKTFKIGRKIPLGLKIAPILVVGGLAAALLGGSSGGGGGEAEVLTLPVPPVPGG
jgi:hypothetical protein